MKFSKRMLLIGVLVLVAALGLAACDSDDDGDNKNSSPTSDPNESARSTYTTLDVNAAHTQIDKDNTAILVDVRQPEEWTATGIPTGAVLISLPTFQETTSGEIPGLPKDKPIYVICNSGNRSRVAAEILIGLGYQSVLNVDGGIQAWLTAGLPTEPYTP